MKRYLLIALVLIGVGCKRVREFGGPSGVSPSGSTAFDGTWRGVTSQGFNLQFTVSDGFVESVSHQWNCFPGDFNVQSSTYNFFTPPLITDASFIIPNYFGMTLSGTFPTNGSSTGSIQETTTSCGGPITTNWSATRN